MTVIFISVVYVDCTISNGSVHMTTSFILVSFVFALCITVILFVFSVYAGTLCEIVSYGFNFYN